MDAPVRKPIKPKGERPVKMRYRDEDDRKKGFGNHKRDRKRPFSKPIKPINGEDMMIMRIKSSLFTSLCLILLTMSITAQDKQLSLHDLIPGGKTYRTSYLVT